MPFLSQFLFIIIFIFYLILQSNSFLISILWIQCYHKFTLFFSHLHASFTLKHVLHEVHKYNSFLYLLIKALLFFNDIFNQNLKFTKVFFLILLLFLVDLILFYLFQDQSIIFYHFYTFILSQIIFFFFFLLFFKLLRQLFLNESIQEPP